MKILVCGGRDFERYDALCVILDELLEKLDTGTVEIVSGHCRGADMLGEKYAREHNIKVKLFPADWNTHGKAAGPIRNKMMVDYITPFEERLVIAFLSKESRGTRHTVSLARERKIPVIEAHYEIRDGRCAMEKIIKDEGILLSI